MYYAKYIKYKKKYESLIGGAALELYKIGPKEYHFTFEKYLDINGATDMIFTDQGMIVITQKGDVYLVGEEIRKQDYKLDPKFTSEDTEQGLLGIAKINDTIYLSYTIDDGSEGTSLVVEELDGKRILQIHSPTKYHHGGHIVVHNNMLYLGTGDGGPQGDPNNHAQGDTLNGKMIQINPINYEIKIIASGLRQPWIFSFDDQDRMWIGDVGWNKSESVKVIKDVNKFNNFGWNYYEGSLINKPPPPNINFTKPIFEYPTSDKTGRAIIGGFFVDGAYIFADYLGFVRAIKFIDGYWKEVGNDKFSGKIFSLAYDGKHIYILADKGIYTLREM